MRTILRIVVVVLWVLAIAVVCFAYPSENADGVWNSRIITREKMLYSYDNVKYYEIAAVTAAPYTCDAAHIGDMVYKDDTNDADEARICYCGTDADDTSYVWMELNWPATDCW